MSDSLQPHAVVACQTPLSMEFPGKNTGMGYHFLLWGIFPTQELNLCLLHCRQSPALQADSLLTEHQGSPNNKYNNYNKREKKKGKEKEEGEEEEE